MRLACMYQCPLLCCAVLALVMLFANAQLTQEPFCPYDVANAGNELTRVQLGLSGYTFDEVFGASVAVLAGQGLQCSEFCDGTGSADSVVCSGPHACSRRTCVMSNAERVPRACPAEAVTGSESTAELQAKVDAECVECERCEGRGCARECSQLLCYDGHVYDWTARRCHRCSELRSAQLCAAADGFAPRTVSGDVPRLRFDACVARGSGLSMLDLSYGRCVECGFQACAHDEFPDHGCRCARCRRGGAGAGVYFDENGALAAAVCQALHCGVGSSRVGVHPDGQVCGRTCAPRVCAAGERQVGCRQPIDTLCVPLWPPRQRAGALRSNETVSFAAFVRAVGANMLESAAATGFAGFEDALVDTLESLPDNHAQCVYNAQNVLEETHGGGASVHFAGIEGKLCRARETFEDSRRPLLPLQNVAALGEGHALGRRLRRLLINVPARAALWTYNGIAHDEDIDDITPPPRSAAGVDGNEVFLLADKGAWDCRLLCHVVDDRRLASWPYRWRVAVQGVDLDGDSLAGAVLGFAEMRNSIDVRVTPRLAASVRDLFEPGPWGAALYGAGTLEVDAAGCAVFGGVEAMDAGAALVAACQADAACDQLPAGVWRAAHLGTPRADDRGAEVAVADGLLADSVAVLQHGFAVAASLQEVRVVDLRGPPYASRRWAAETDAGDAASVFVACANMYCHPCVAQPCACQPAAVVVAAGTRVEVRVFSADAGGNLTAAAVVYAAEHVQAGGEQVRAVAYGPHSQRLLLCKTAGSVVRVQRFIVRFYTGDTYYELQRVGVTADALDVAAVSGANARAEECAVAETADAPLGVPLTAVVCSVRDGEALRMHARVLNSTSGQSLPVVLAPRRVLDVNVSVAWVVPQRNDSVADAVISAGGRLFVLHVSPAGNVELRRRFYGPGVGRYATVTGVGAAGGGMLFVHRAGQLSAVVQAPWRPLHGQQIVRAYLAAPGVSDNACAPQVRQALTAGYAGGTPQAVASIASMYRVGELRFASPTTLTGANAVMEHDDVSVGGVPQTTEQEFLGSIPVKTEHLANAEIEVLAGELTLEVRTGNPGTMYYECKADGVVKRMGVMFNDETMVFRQTSTEFYRGGLGGSIAPNFQCFLTASGDVSWTAALSADYSPTPLAKGAWTTVERFDDGLPATVDVRVTGAAATVGLDSLELEPCLGPGSNVRIERAAVEGWERMGIAVAGRAEGWARVHVMLRVTAIGPDAQTVAVAPASDGNRSLECMLARSEPCVLEVPRSWLPAVVRGTHVFVTPSPAQWECAPDEFQTRNGECKPCGGVCLPGTYDDRCAELEADKQCAHSCPNTLPAFAVYEPSWFLRDGECAWKCTAGYVREGSACVLCADVTCAPGTEKQTCSGSLDTVCTPCDISRFGDFWHNENFTSGCNSTCVHGTFRVGGVCMPCSTPEQVLSTLRSGVPGADQFYEFEACTESKDTRAVPCRAVPNGRSISDAAGVGQRCGFECNTGFRATSQDTCASCPPLLGLDGSVVPQEGYFVDSLCQATCRAPYVNRTVGGQSSCAVCNASCAVGQYRTGDMCDECRACAAPAVGFVHVSDGDLDDPASCRAACAPGTYDRFGFGTCVAHSSPTCAAMQFLRAGTAVHDAFCVNCSSCEGSREVVPCSAAADAQCAACGAAPTGAAWIGTACATACLHGWLLNVRSQQCEFCADFSCPAGKRKPEAPDNCTHCESCVAPAHAVFTNGCTYVCAGGFQTTVQENETPASGESSVEIACAPASDNEQRRVMRDVHVRCEPGLRLDENYGCQPCDVLIPADNTTWTWSGGECEWTCADLLVRHSRTASVACVTPAQLKVETQMEHGIVSTRWDRSNLRFDINGPDTMLASPVFITTASVLVVFTLALLVAYCLQRRQCCGPRRRRLEEEGRSEDGEAESGGAAVAL